MIGQFITAWAATQSDLVALIGARVRPQEAATADGYPYVTYFVVDETNVSSFGGPSGLTTPRVQMDILAKTYAEANAIAQKIKGTKNNRRLDGYRGEINGLVVQCVRFNDRRDQYDEPVDGQSTGAHRIILDFTFWLEE